MAPLHWVAFILSIVSTIRNHTGLVEAATSENIGVCYGMLGNDLPPGTDVVDLYKKNGIKKMRLFDPNPNTLQALRGSQIHVTLGIRNEDLSSLAASPDAMNSWFSTNVEPYLDDVTFDYISAGNEVIPGSLGGYVLPVMQNLQNILNAKNLATRIKVSTVVPGSVLGSSYPPSSSAFTADTLDVMSAILAFLSRQGSPLLINVYPYFAYKSDPANVRSDYAQFTATTPGAIDGNLNYYKLFDAIVDAFYSAMEKVGAPNVNVVVTESGWPSDGNGDFTTPQLAATYNQNFLQRTPLQNMIEATTFCRRFTEKVVTSTPKRQPGRRFESSLRFRRFSFEATNFAKKVVAWTSQATTF